MIVPMFSTYVFKHFFKPYHNIITIHKKITSQLENIIIVETKLLASLLQWHSIHLLLFMQCWCFLGGCRFRFRLWFCHEFVSKCLDIVPLILVFPFHFSTFFGSSNISLQSEITKKIFQC
jgi:hypothetical protein